MISMRLFSPRVYHRCNRPPVHPAQSIVPPKAIVSRPTPPAHQGVTPAHRLLMACRGEGQGAPGERPRERHPEYPRVAQREGRPAGRRRDPRAARGACPKGAAMEDRPGDPARAPVALPRPVQPAFPGAGDPCSRTADRRAARKERRQACPNPAPPGVRRARPLAHHREGRLVARRACRQACRNQTTRGVRKARPKATRVTHREKVGSHSHPPSPVPEAQACGRKASPKAAIPA